jgi:acetyltransferase
LLGVDRLVADADHTNAEFAILVGDPWQGRGIGSLLLDHCLEICARWGIQNISAQTTVDNSRMLAMFQHRGFALVPTADAVLATKTL